jgi:DNA-binding NarL/FixJ family response regulator
MVTINPRMKKLHAIIVSRPGSWQKMLQYYLEEYPFVGVDQVASGGLSAIQLVKDHQLDLLVIDSSIPFEDVDVLVRSVKKMQPDMCVIVIVDTIKEGNKISRAGADYAISSCNFEMQISEILNKINQNFSNYEVINEQNIHSNEQQ